MPPSLRPEELGQRILVVGTCGSGKSTLAGQLSRRLNLVHVELDALYHEANWTPAPPERFKARLLDAIAGDRWVVDGNYAASHEILWPRADALVWLDLSLPLVLWQLTRRTTRRIWTREELWNGNVELLSQHLQADGLFPWAIKTHGRNRRRYATWTSLPENGHLRVVRLRSRREISAWMADASREGAGEG